MDPVLKRIIEMLDGNDLDEDATATSERILISAWSKIENPDTGSSVAEAALSVFDEKMRVADEAISAVEARLRSAPP